MVGVPGKSKGCNTCRTRRVKCDNLRPKCQKCLDSGRECGGYERQMIFIVGTTNERGRCSSHPHRSLLVAKAKKKRESAQGKSPAKVDSKHRPNPPSAASSRVGSSSSDGVQCLFLHSKPLSLDPLFERDGDAFTLPTVMHTLPEFNDSVQVAGFSLHAFSFLQESAPTPNHSNPFDDDANPRAKKKAHLADDVLDSSKNNQIKPATTALFIYEQPGLSAGEAGPFRHLHGGPPSSLQSRGPSAFQKFPDHHFFSHLYRPFACFDAMSRRKSTFLASPEWCDGPWEDVPKNDMDHLFDIQVKLPAIFERAERTEALPPSVHRKLKAKDLLDNCSRIDRSFEEWYNQLHSRSDSSLFWTVDASANFGSRNADEWKPRNDLDTIFPTNFEFVDVKTAFLHLYYWAALCLFYQTIQRIQHNCMEIMPASSNTAPSAYSPPVSQTFLAAPSASYTPPPALSYSSTSPHVSVSSEADVFTQIPFDHRSIYAPMPYSTFPTATYASTIPLSTQMYTPTPEVFYDFPESFFSAGPAVAPTPACPSLLVNLHDQSLFFFTQTSSPHAQHSPYSQPSQLPPSSSSLPTPTPPSRSSHTPSSASSALDSKFSRLAILNLANNIAQTIPYVLQHEEGVEALGPDMLAWPLRRAREVYEREGCAA